MSTSTLSADAISFVCATVRSRAAIELDDTKCYLIEARLTPVARASGYSSIDELIQGIRGKSRPDLEGRLVEAMTTNETSFFRDIHPFEALRKQIVPELLQRNGGTKRLNIWSAACSTGQEIYSVAMYLREHFPVLTQWNVQLLGTDLSEDVLNRAREAKFSQNEVNRGLSAGLLVKYFQREGIHWKLKPELSGMARFSKLNLIESWPAMPRMDIVFLRNVLIYFSPDTKKMILEKVRKIMAPQALLFLGAAETTMGLSNDFERVQFEQSVFYRLK
ncbi:MAG: protein-glutamate O-methyltransferase CheR [Pirellulales bacterium]|nr:protein-glutamate O-methyltransferase CheR [Pirellulales bacterium]